MNGTATAFVAGPGTAYAGPSALALHAGPLDGDLAAAIDAATDVEPLLRLVTDMTGIAVVLRRVDNGEVAVACRGEVIVDVDGVEIRGTDDWSRTMFEIESGRPMEVAVRLVTDTSVDSPRHRTERGTAPAGAVWRTFDADRVADSFDALFGRTEERSVEGAAVRPGEAPRRRVSEPLGVLVFSTGARVVVDKATVIGRNPKPPGDVAVDLGPPRLVKIASPGVSRQHAIVRLDRWHATIDDLGSSNGTCVTLPGRPPVRLVPGTPADLVPGARVELGGDVSFVVEEVA